MQATLDLTRYVYESMRIEINPIWLGTPSSIYWPCSLTQRTPGPLASCERRWPARLYVCLYATDVLYLCYVCMCVRLFEQITTPLARWPDRKAAHNRETTHTHTHTPALAEHMRRFRVLCVFATLGRCGVLRWYSNWNEYIFFLVSFFIDFCYFGI